MKKLLFLLSFILLFNLTEVTTSFAAENKWPDGPDVYAKSAVLIDADSGTILYDKKADTKRYPASITKIMTALLTIENTKMNDTVTFSKNSINSLQYGDANFGCQIGEKMSIKECLYALMLSSANEAATALGEHVGGSVDNFAKMMTERAKAAGAKNTNFVNCNGLHNKDHYVTAYDMAMITRDALKYDSFKKIVHSTTYTVKKNNKRKTNDQTLQRHKMVWLTSGYYYDGIIGGKTGYTDQAGNTLVTAAKRNGTTLICVVLKSNTFNVYEDTKKILDFGFDNFVNKNVSENDTRFTGEKNTYSLKSPFTDYEDNIYIDPESSVILPKNFKFNDLSSSVVFEKNGNSFAKVIYKYGDKTVGSANLIYEKNGKTDSESKTTKASTSLNNKINITTVSKKDSNKNTKKESTKNNKKVDNNNNKKTNNSATLKIIIMIILVFGALIGSTIFVKNKRKKLRHIRTSKRQRYYRDK